MLCSEAPPYMRATNGARGKAWNTRQRKMTVAKRRVCRLLVDCASETTAIGDITVGPVLAEYGRTYATANDPERSYTWLRSRRWGVSSPGARPRTLSGFSIRDGRFVGDGMSR